MGPDWRVRPFGSIASGFGTAGSDLDVTCYREGVDAQDAGLAVQELKLRLLPLLAHHSEFQVVEEVWAARVPILRLKFRGNVEIDLSCHNPEALQNTHLLKAYASMDAVLRQLVIVVKVWAKMEGVCGAAGRNLSSYSLTLMVIYFLQVQPDLKLPCLPTWAFDHNGPTHPMALATWSCNLPLHVLFARFAKFYASEFQWGSEVASVRLGFRALAMDSAFEQLPGRLNQRLHIEDPFLLRRNLNCVLGQMQEEQLWGKLVQLAHGLASGLPILVNPEGYPPEAKLDNAAVAEEDDAESTNSGCRSSLKSLPEPQTLKVGSDSDSESVNQLLRPPQPQCFESETTRGPRQEEMPLPSWRITFSV